MSLYSHDDPHTEASILQSGRCEETHHSARIIGSMRFIPALADTDIDDGWALDDPSDTYPWSEVDRVTLELIDARGA